MWFGDLVTMSWWNGLWFNEAFATFMEMLAVDAWKPEWKRWDAFGVSRGAAFAVDGLHSTRPIEFPVRAPKDAEAMFDVLTYEKGASVLRMLEQHIGPTVFRDGVRRLSPDACLWQCRHKRPLGLHWQSFESGRPRPDGRMDFPAGYPLVTAELTKECEVVLTQQRFSYLPRSASGQLARPVQLRVQTGRRRRFGGCCSPAPG